jgi:opine dehydrogenase
MSPSVAVIGAGDAGKALAATLAAGSAEVTLFARGEEPLRPLRGGLVLQRPEQAEERVAFARLTTNLDEAVRGVDTVFIVTNSTAHAELGARLARCLSARQLVVLVPGHTGGALDFRSAWLRSGGDPALRVAETQALPFVCRSPDATTVKILQQKRRVRLACLPGRESAAVVDRLRRLLPELEPAASTLALGFDNMTAVIQPCLLLFNAARIEHGEEFSIYRGGISPSTARVMQALDEERLAIAAAYGIEAQAASAWLGESYGARGAALYERLLDTEGYAAISAPGTLEHRFLREHVPMGTVPIAELGALARQRAPLLNALISLASALLGTDLRHGGRRLERLGLAGHTVQDVARLCADGA